MFNWLNAREATEAGVALADDFVLQSADSSAARDRNKGSGAQGTDLAKFMQRFLQRVDRDTRALRLNVFKRAKLANSFKWRLLEKGVDRGIADELTSALVLRLTARATTASAAAIAASATGRDAGLSAPTLVAEANDCMARGAYDDAVSRYQQALSLIPRDAVVLNSLGAAFTRCGRYPEAEAAFRRALGIKAAYADAHCNLGTLLRWCGKAAESEQALRRALRLKPAHVDAKISLSATLLLLGRLPEAKQLLEAVLRVAPGNVNALTDMGQVLAYEGSLAHAEVMLRRATETDPQAPSAWAALARLRKMTAADAPWFKQAERIAARRLVPREETNLRYAMGKYCDDVADYDRAFGNFRRANELQKKAAQPYDRQSRTRWAEDMRRAYTREVLSASSAGASDSARPVLVVGMPRSGTSLVEQIIASHPAVTGAGELTFWGAAMRKHDAALRHAPPDAPLRRKLAASYLGLLKERSPEASRVVDKAPFNSEYLGVIHAVFPNARLIYVRRDPIDTCLSCYFQQLSADMDFSMDLADLAHYYAEHERLVAHWRDVLPPGTLLEVPYEELIADQEAWTHKLVEFLDLEWDPRCLTFDVTQRPVVTASYWQVRQKIYASSVGRWRNYAEFIGPLLDLHKSDR